MNITDFSHWSRYSTPQFDHVDVDRATDDISSVNWGQCGVATIIIVLLILLLVFRKPYAELTARHQRRMFGWIGERVAKNSTPKVFVFVAVCGLLLATGMLLDGLSDRRDRSPTVIGKNALQAGCR